jgi:choline-glycine betaine transporter
MIQLHQLQFLAVLLPTFLVLAAITGWSALRTYEQIRKGIQRNSRFHLWLGFFLAAFIFITLTFAILKVAS